MVARKRPAATQARGRTAKAQRADSHVGNLDDDTATLTTEKNWFRAADHRAELLEHAKAWHGRRFLHCLDAFGAS
eukprot:13094689-Alexandrium_andersonii.AAC.1